MRRWAVLGVWLLASCEPRAVAPSQEPSLATLLRADDPGFATAAGPRTFEFPEDHGPHDGFRNEWWYFTGNLDDAAGQRFGYELTLFRFALAPPSLGTVAPGPWRTQHVFVGHFAISDVANDAFYTAERVSRQHSQLAGAQADPLRVFIDDWEIAQTTGADANTWRLRAAHGDTAINLTVRSLRNPVLNGDRGRSQKSSDPQNASYYYSIPRWATHGQVTVQGKSTAVTGESWLDREWSSSALGDDQLGWDWFALQLNDGSELMLYQLRRRDGSIDPFSSGTWRRSTNDVQRLSHNDFSLTVTDEWRNDTGAIYPAGWHIEIPGESVVLDVTPAMANQELKTIVRYWEGAVDVTGNHGNDALQGRGYVELTGYADKTRQGLGRR